uniref:Uncharacterized protein n=1 Tax=Plectus sambesii TaxID=2011161 RepID=A0A914V156_9BILA
MPICPSSLEELSLDCLVANVQDFVEHKKGEVDDEEAVDPLVRPPASSPAEWPPLPAEVGNKLLNKVRERGSLNQHSLKFFTSDRVRLTEVDLTACEVSLNSLRVLRDHRLDSLSLS